MYKLHNFMQVFTRGDKSLKISMVLLAVMGQSGLCTVEAPN